MDEENKRHHERKFDEESGSDKVANFDHIELGESQQIEILEKCDIDKAEKMINQRYPLYSLGVIDVFRFLQVLAFWRSRKVSDILLFYGFLSWIGF